MRSAGRHRHVLPAAEPFFAGAHCCCDRRRGADRAADDRAQPRLGGDPRGGGLFVDQMTGHYRTRPLNADAGRGCAQWPARRRRSCNGEAGVRLAGVTSDGVPKPVPAAATTVAIGHGGRSWRRACSGSGAHAWQNRQKPPRRRGSRPWRRTRPCRRRWDWVCGIHRSRGLFPANSMLFCLLLTCC